METKQDKKKFALTYYHTKPISNFSGRLLISTDEKVANGDNDGNQNDDELVLWHAFKMKDLTDLP